MTTSRNNKINRRSLLEYAAVALVAPSVVRAETIRRNISSFRVHDWQDHFDTLGKGIIISDTVTMALQHWTADGEMRIYPTSVPLTDELTKRGYTEVVEKRKNPSWAPTPSMRERNPEWPARIEGVIRTTPWVLAHCTCRGSTTVFTGHRTRARSTAGRQTAASVCSTNRSRKSTSGHLSALKSNSSDPTGKAEDTGMDKLTALIGAVFVIGGVLPFGSSLERKIQRLATP